MMISQTLMAVDNSNFVREYQVSVTLGIKRGDLLAWPSLFK